MDKQFRHGDVYLRQVAALPQGAQEVRREGDVILALGEVTGHAHRIATPGVKMWDANGQRYITVEGKPASLTHEEHRTLTPPPGVYEVIQQREWDLAGEVRNVED